jgi:glycosyltransferase involved in cell wall biosynthesis
VIVDLYGFMASNKQKICHLTSAHPAFDIRIFHRECRSLVEAGYEVTLVAPHERDEVVNGIKIMAIPKAKGRFQRMTLTTVQVYQQAIRQNADLYHLHDPELLLLAPRLQRVTGSPVIYDAHEYVAMDVAEKNWLPRPIAIVLSKISNVVEKYVSSRLAGVVVVNSHMAGLFQPVAKNVAVVSNYPNKKLLQSSSGVKPESDSVIYIGLMNKMRGFELVLKAMEIVRKQRPSAVCRIIGDFDKRGIRSQPFAPTSIGSESHGVTLFKKTKYENIPGHIAAHAVGWLPWQLCQANLYGIPNKLLEYMALARPVVASDLEFISQIVNDNECGIIVPWNSPEAHAQALLYLFDHPEEAQRLGENGRRAVREKLNWENQFISLTVLYDSCLRKEKWW